jgi:hypothetical protein
LSTRQIDSFQSVKLTSQYVFCTWDIFNNINFWTDWNCSSANAGYLHLNGSSISCNIVILYSTTRDQHHKHCNSTPCAHHPLCESKHNTTVFQQHGERQAMVPEQHNLFSGSFWTVRACQLLVNGSVCNHISPILAGASWCGSAYESLYHICEHY